MRRRPLRRGRWQRKPVPSPQSFHASCVGSHRQNLLAHFSCCRCPLSLCLPLSGFFLSIPEKNSFFAYNFPLAASTCPSFVVVYLRESALSTGEEGQACRARVNVIAGGEGNQVQGAEGASVGGGWVWALLLPIFVALTLAYLFARLFFLFPLPSTANGRYSIHFVRQQ